MRILVVNPNSSVEVTRGISKALAPLGNTFDVTCLPQSPKTIRTDDDVMVAGQAFADLAASNADAAGFIIACFSDPGLDMARARIDKPVTGAQEAAVLLACKTALQFGIIALSERAIPRHLKRIEAMGCLDRVVAELPLHDVSAVDAGQDPEVYRQVFKLAVKLRDQGAGAIVLGCAGFAQLTARLQADVGVPIIDPILAAGQLALARARNGGLVRVMPKSW